MKITVFDIGGTLMEYVGMPNVWLDFYPKAFEHISKKLPQLTDSEITRSLEIMRSYNPKVNYREIDYSPEKIFGDVVAHWKCDFELGDVIIAFFESMHLTAYTYPESIAALKELKEHGCIIATLTDVASGMPDELHKSYFKELLPYFDMYVSSQSCGYRKPNPKGLEDIAEKYAAQKSDMVFIGDEEKDIITARRFGCKAVLIDRRKSGANFGQDVTLTDLTDIKELLK